MDTKDKPVQRGGSGPQDYRKLPDEALQKMQADVAGRTGWKGAVADFINPSPRKAAEAATAEMERRKQEAAAAAAAAAKQRAAQERVKAIDFKRGGAIKARGKAVKPAKTAVVRGWGAARGAKKAKVY